MKTKHLYESPELEVLMISAQASFATLSDTTLVDPNPDDAIQLPGVPLD